MNHYLLWAFGKDRTGIVAGISAVLFKQKCNLEDSSMMRLGSEFGVLLIFSSKKSFSVTEQKKLFLPLEKQGKLTIGFKKISAKEARFAPLQKSPYMVTVYGADRPGLVYKVTSILGKNGF